ncbi:putative transcription initiation factor TFIID subunit 12 [Aspergillus mulundensis]|uniref:Transcription initiation factor TFIID subunit 12 domain-containing protein n=1 Tax=Aspergillus mulundensis TaxID=1810919 RepID=A0A3D8SK39_9EURO|nr:hypothetical protein DSM5745_02780 [Aspergillus mulundensis]RDW86138.1 hypothetical protein DSM5745_02780 [Aspergillus mulundensis]
MVPQHSNLIRTDQVQKLPHLNDQQKVQHTQIVRNFWEILNSRDAQTPEYQQAHTRLSQLSQSLMKGMRMYQQNRQLQHQQMQAASAAQGQPVQRSQSVNPQNFAQLLPQFQQKVNSLQLFLPPNISSEQAGTWLPEAKLRYGIALQKQEIGRARLSELRQQHSQRQIAGNLTQEEMQEFKNRQVQAEKLFREGSEFLTKFKEQQDVFKAQQQRAGTQHPGQQLPPQGGARPATTASTASAGPTAAPTAALSGPTPAAHTINSAVSAARNQAAQAAISPTPQPGQAPPNQGVTPAPAIAGTPQQPQPLQPQMQAQQNAPVFNQVSAPDGSTPTASTTPAANVQGPPRPLSQQAAMAQAAQNYSNNTNVNSVNNTNAVQQQNINQPSVNSHAHPQGYIQNRSTENSARNVNMVIPKNLNVSPTKPVSMAPDRPTLSSGPSHGAMGMMGQPAIQKHPGYVLEGEGQRVLSKKMLDVLVRQVTGGGDGEGLTPDAEEFMLQMADDFVDDVITAACRLAKLRHSSSLEIRDLQLVLERNYNMRISGFSTDDLRTVKKPQPTQGWTQKMSAVQAAKVTQGKAE